MAYEKKEIKFAIFVSNYNNIIYILLILIFIYTCIRAYFLSIAHDEALTFLIHASGTFPQIFTFALPLESNNHLLNTFLIKIFVMLFGNHEFVIRIPALIGHGLYLVGIFKLLKLFLSKQFLLLGICLLILNPFTLDFFSCARGYSFGLGFFIFALYYSFKIIENSESKLDDKNIVMVLIMLVLAVLSHFSFLNLFLSMMSIILLFELKRLIKIIKETQLNNPILKQFLAKIIFPIMRGILFLLIIYVRPTIKMVRLEQFSFGGTEGFWKDTVESLIKVILYGKNYFHFNVFLWAKLIVITLLIFSLSVLLYKLIKRQKFNLMDKYLFFTTILLFFLSFSIIFQHILFNIKYVVERTVIYFIPLFFIFILILWQSLDFIKNNIIKISINCLFYLLIIILLIHFITCMNFTNFFTYKSDASTKDMMNYLIEINKGKELKNRSMSMGIHWPDEPSINYYIVKNNLTWMKFVDRRGPDGLFDYYYIYTTDKDLIEKYKLKIIKIFNITDTCLAIPLNY